MPVGIKIIKIEIVFSILDHYSYFLLIIYCFLLMIRFCALYFLIWQNWIYQKINDVIDYFIKHIEADYSDTKEILCKKVLLIILRKDW